MPARNRLLVWLVALAILAMVLAFGVFHNREDPAMQVPARLDFADGLSEPQRTSAKSNDLELNTNTRLVVASPPGLPHTG